MYVTHALSACLSKDVSGSGKKDFPTKKNSERSDNREIL